MSGRFTSWNKQAVFATIYDRALGAATDIAQEIQRTAVLRAPIRKAFKGRRLKKVELADFKQKVGNAQYTGADLLEAAGHLGIPLDAHAAVQISRSRGANRTSFSGRRERRTIDGRTRYRRVTGLELRRVSAVRVREGKKIKTVGYIPDAKRLRKQSVLLTSRARRDIQLGRGVISIGRGRHQYGGYLRKHIELETVQSDPGSKVVHYRVISRAAYSRFVEFPTSRTAAQPFLLPSLKAQREKYPQRMRRAVAG